MNTVGEKNIFISFLILLIPALPFSSCGDGGARQDAGDTVVDDTPADDRDLFSDPDMPSDPPPDSDVVLDIPADETISIEDCDFFVDADAGSDDHDGASESSPWRTVQKAATELVAGETVCIKRGTYNERVTVENSGEDGSPITFTAYPGDEGLAVIDGSGISYENGGLFHIQAMSHIHVFGLAMRNAAYNGFYVDKHYVPEVIGEHIVLSNLTVENAGNAAILVRNSHFVVVEGCSTRDSVSSGVGIWGSFNVIVDHNRIVNARNVPTDEGGNQECISISNTDSFEVRYNEVYYDGIEGYLGGAGIDVKESSRNGRVFGNYIHDVVNDGAIYLDAWMAGLDEGDPTLHNVEVFGNYVRNCGSGVSIGSERGGTAEDIKIYNNMLVQLKYCGIIISDTSDDGPRRNITITSNTIFESLQHGGGGVFVKTTNVENIVIRNNISAFGPNWQGQFRSTSPDNVTADHNLAFGETMFPEEELPGSIVADPLFENPESYEPEGLRLTGGSPAIDQGTDADAPDTDYFGNPRPVDGDEDSTAQFDIGAFEFSP